MSLLYTGPTSLRPATYPHSTQPIDSALTANQNGVLPLNDIKNFENLLRSKVPFPHASLLADRPIGKPPMAENAHAYETKGEKKLFARLSSSRTHLAGMQACKIAIAAGLLFSGAFGAIKLYDVALEAHHGK